MLAGLIGTIWALDQAHLQWQALRTINRRLVWAALRKLLVDGSEWMMRFLPRKPRSNARKDILQLKGLCAQRTPAVAS